MHFSSKGALTTILDYHVPNNHIFYNLVNALTPGADSVEPLRARMWSFISVCATIAMGAVFFVRRKHYFEAGVFVFVVGANTAILDLCLQARGYGFLLFCSTGTVLLTLEYLRTFKIAYFVGIGLLTVLGTWTLPLYVIFSGGLMLVLFWHHRRRNAFFVGAGAFALIVLVYLPVLADLVDHTVTYGDQWGYQYASVSSVYQTFNTYLIGVFRYPSTKYIPDWLLLFVLVAGLLAPWVLSTEERDEEGGAVSSPDIVALRLVGIATFLFFCVCLYMGTPGIRTTSFIVMPMALTIIMVYRPIIRRTNSARFAPLLVAALGGGLLWIGYSRIENFRFVPIESWRSVSESIKSDFQDREDVFVTFRGHFLSKYLDGSINLVEKFDPTRFASGAQIVVDGNIQIPTRDRFNGEHYSSVARYVDFPQRRGGYQRLWYVAQ